MRRSINSFDSNWSVGNPNSVAVDPTIPDLWEAPSVDQLMEVEEPTVDLANTSLVDHSSSSSTGAQRQRSVRTDTSRAEFEQAAH